MNSLKQYHSNNDNTDNTDDLPTITVIETVTNTITFFDKTLKIINRNNKDDICTMNVPSNYVWYVLLKGLKFYYKFKHSNLTHYLNNMPLLPNRDTHDHATRTQTNIHQTRTNHDYAK